MASGEGRGVKEALLWRPLGGRAIRMREPLFSYCTVEIHLDCLRRNLYRVVRRAGMSPKDVMPVVKSDAYGHGLLPVVRTLAREGVEHFAVGTVEEGEYLRQAGLDPCIVTLMGAPGQDAMTRAAAARLTPLIHDISSLRRAAAVTGAERPLDVALKVETGMGRLGFTLDQLPTLLEELRQAPQLHPVLLLSHLACADMPERDPFTREQGALFSSAYATLREACPHLRRSLCNSAGALAYPALAGDLLRPGEALYGGNVLFGTGWDQWGAELEQVMHVRAPILQVQSLAAGEPVGYGSMFTASQPTRLAVVSIGYGDGYSRGLSNKGFVVIAGHRAPVRGRVCMGMIMADVTDIPVDAVHEGDPAWITGGPHAAAVSIQELADLWGTISYEAQCQLGRNMRLYVGGEVPD